MQTVLPASVLFATLMFSSGILPAGWWQEPFSLLSDSSEEAMAAAGADSVRELAHGGWYGVWYKDVPQVAATQEQRLSRADRHGLKKVLYFDTGELGEFVVWVDPQKRIRHTAWTLQDYNGAPGELRWLGIQQFFENPDWVDLKSAATCGLEQLTYPDGRPPDPGNWYDAVAAKDINGRLFQQFYSNKAVTDDLAKLTGLDQLSRRQEARVAGTANKEGWVTVRQWRVDPANRQYTDYACRELEIALRHHRPDAVHFDDFLRDNLIMMTNVAFGDWSVAAFKEYLQKNVSRDRLAEWGIENLESWDVREWFRTRPWRSEFDKFENAEARYFQSPRWREEPLYRLYQLAILEVTRERYQRLHDTVKRVSRELGREIPVMGNANPVFPGQSFASGMIDIPSFEWATYKHYGFLEHPMGLPPEGRIAPYTRLAALSAGSGFSIPATYVTQDLKGPGTDALFKVMFFDCLANLAVYDFGHWFLEGVSPGSAESAAFCNHYLRENRAFYSDRQPLADIAVLYSPWSQYAAALPGNTAMPGRQLFLGEYIGWADFLTHENLPWTPVLTTQLTGESLQKFALVIVPSVISLSSKEIEVLHDYVTGGGRLIVTGPTGKYQGPEGWLMPYPETSLGGLFRKPGVVHVPDQPGYTYHQSQRSEEAAGVLRGLLGSADYKAWVDVGGVPVSVGLSYYRHPDGTLLVDAVNYALDLPGNRVEPSGPVRISFTPDFAKSYQWENVRVISAGQEAPRAETKTLPDGRVELILPPIPWITTLAVPAAHR